jgi:hypothetical protein
VESHLVEHVDAVAPIPAKPAFPQDLASTSARPSAAASATLVTRPVDPFPRVAEASLAAIAPEAPTVEITIERLEIHAAQPGLVPAAKHRPPPGPAMTLGDYLRKRKEVKRG